MSDRTLMIVTLIATLSLTLVLGAPTRWFLTTAAILDVPNQRSSHSRPTLRGGGIACWAGVALATMMVWMLGSQAPVVQVAAATVLSGVGFIDDVRTLSPVARLGAQTAVGFATGALLGGIWSAVLGAVTFPIVVNAVNFMDGINGITSATLIGWSAALLLGHVEVGADVPVLAALVLGAAAGFLPWNIPSARMFLGDSGSYFFGALIAAAIVSTQATGGQVWVVAGGLSLYLVDTCYTLLRRARHREALFHAHREHLYQRLQRSTTWSHVRVAALMGAGALLAGLAWTVDARLGLAATAALGGALIVVTESLDARARRVDLEHP